MNTSFASMYSGLLSSFKDEETCKLILQEIENIFSDEVYQLYLDFYVHATGSRVFDTHTEESDFDIVLYSESKCYQNSIKDGYTVCGQFYPHDEHKIFKKQLSNGKILNLICVDTEELYKRWVGSTLLVLGIQKEFNSKLSRELRHSIFSIVVGC